MEDVELIIAQVWKETFHLLEIDRTANFFELGGNSLIAMDMIGKISERLDVELPVVILFQNPSPRELADFIMLENSSESEGLASDS